MAPKPEDVMDLTDPSPKNIDVEYALRKTELGVNPNEIYIICTLLRLLHDRCIHSYPDLLIALDSHWGSREAPRVYDAIVRGKIRPDFENFDANLNSKPRKNYLRGDTCRNAMELIQAIDAEKATRQITINLPEHLYQEINTKSRIDRQLVTCRDVNERFIDEAIREKLDRCEQSPK